MSREPQCSYCGSVRNKTELGGVLFNFRQRRKRPFVPGVHRIILDGTKPAVRKLINSTEHSDRRGAHTRDTTCLRRCWVNESEIVADCPAKLTEIHRSGRPRRLYSRPLPPVARCPLWKCEHVIPYHVTQTDGRLLARDIYRRGSRPVKYDWQRDRVIKVLARSLGTGKWSEIPATTPALSWRTSHEIFEKLFWKVEESDAKLSWKRVWELYESGATKLKSIRIR